MSGVIILLYKQYVLIWSSRSIINKNAEDQFWELDPVPGT